MTKLLQHQVSAPSRERQDEIAALGPWFHNLHLPDGSETAPHHALGDFPAFKWAEIAPHLPQQLSGWRALDIGCNAGFYSNVVIFACNGGNSTNTVTGTGASEVLAGFTASPSSGLKPLLVAEFAFLQWTADDHLRHAHFVALRDGRKATDVRRKY